MFQEKLSFLAIYISIQEAVILMPRVLCYRVNFFCLFRTRLSDKEYVQKYLKNHKSSGYIDNGKRREKQ